MKIKRLHPDAIIPSKAHDGDMGYDLYAIEYTVLHMGELHKLRTGIAIEFPKYFGAMIKDRSSVATKMKLFTVAGVIDSGYIGEILVAMYNAGPATQVIDVGDKIAQLIFVPVVTPKTIEIVDELQSWDDRGAGGFGSTGE